MKTKSNEWEATTRKNTKQLAVWTAAWLVSMAIVAFGPDLWNYNWVISLVFILISTGIGFKMILMNRKYINGLDEMHQKVTMDAMAVALGVAVVGGLSYSMLNSAGVINMDAEISHLVFLIGISYLVAIFVGYNRYK